MANVGSSYWVHFVYTMPQSTVTGLLFLLFIDNLLDGEEQEFLKILTLVPFCLPMMFCYRLPFEICLLVFLSLVVIVILY